MKDLIDFLGGPSKLNPKTEDMSSEEERTETRVLEDQQTGDTGGMSRLEAEVEGLKETCTYLISINRELREQVEAPAATIKPLLKPRDIRSLQVSIQIHQG